MKTSFMRQLGLSALVGLCLVLTTPASAAPPAQVDVCHVPAATPDNTRLIRINDKGTAVNDHLSHGDWLATAEMCDDIADNNCDGVPGTADENDASCGPDQTCDGAVCVDVADCGNGVQEGAERCDDGNLIDNDGCNTACEITEPCPCIEFWTGQNDRELDVISGMIPPITPDAQCRPIWRDTDSNLIAVAQDGSDELICDYFYQGVGGANRFAVENYDQSRNACVRYVEEDAFPGTNICTGP